MYLPTLEGLAQGSKAPSGPREAIAGAEECGELVILDGFDVGDYRMKPSHYEPLRPILFELLKARGSSGFMPMVKIVGHTDEAGSDTMNTYLALNRALEVKRFIAGFLAMHRFSLLIVPGSEKERKEFLHQLRADNRHLVLTSVTSEGGIKPVSINKRKNRRVELRWCRLRVPSLSSASA